MSVTAPCPLTTITHSSLRRAGCAACAACATRGPGLSEADDVEAAQGPRSAALLAPCLQKDAKHGMLGWAVAGVAHVAASVVPWSCDPVGDLLCGPHRAWTGQRAACPAMPHDLAKFWAAVPVHGARAVQREAAVRQAAAIGREDAGLPPPQQVPCALPSGAACSVYVLQGCEPRPDLFEEVGREWRFVLARQKWSLSLRARTDLQV
jgi:hypothetical protein